MEGDDRVYVDGSRSPSIYGTGTEDNFNGGFYYQNGAFALPTHGAGPLGVTPIEHSTQSQYRVFGGDAVLWSNGIRYGSEHGAGDENVERVATTTFSYRAPTALVQTDEVRIGDPSSERAHALAGAFDRARLTAYFEGDNDGALAVPDLALAGDIVSPPPELSPEGFGAEGIALARPVSVRLAVDARNCGVVLRRLFDAAGPAPSDLGVAVEGRAVGRWYVAETNPYKRWREEDFEVPAELTQGRSVVAVTFRPGGVETIYALTAWSRAC
jgi:hypothetical protein